MMGLLLTFLIGAVKTSPRLGCQIVSAILHFFILSTFCWMLVEAFNFYHSFVKVFKNFGDANVLRNASIFAWGKFKNFAAHSLHASFNFYFQFIKIYLINQITFEDHLNSLSKTLFY